MTSESLSWSASKRLELELVQRLWQKPCWSLPSQVPIKEKKNGILIIRVCHSRSGTITYLQIIFKNQSLMQNSQHYPPFSCLSAHCKSPVLNENFRQCSVPPQNTRQSWKLFKLQLSEKREEMFPSMSDLTDTHITTSASQTLKVGQGNEVGWTVLWQFLSFEVFFDGTNCGPSCGFSFFFSKDKGHS